MFFYCRPSTRQLKPSYSHSTNNVGIFPWDKLLAILNRSTGYRRCGVLILSELWWGQETLPPRPSMDYAFDRFDSIPNKRPNEADTNAFSFMIHAVDDGDIPVEDVLSGLCAIARTTRTDSIWRWAFGKCTTNPIGHAIEFDVIEEALSIFGTQTILPM